MNWRHGLAVGFMALVTGCGGDPKPPPPGVKEVEDSDLEVDQGTKVLPADKSGGAPKKPNNGDTPGKADTGESKPVDDTPPDPIGDLPK